MSKAFLAAAFASALSIAPIQPASAGIVSKATKAFAVGSVVVGGIALSQAGAAKHCAENRADPQCDKSVKGTDADPDLAKSGPAAGPVGAPVGTPVGVPGAAPVGAPVFGGGAAPKAPKDPNALIDAGAAKAKDLAAKGSAWLAKKKAEREAKAAAKAAGAAPGSPVAASEPAPAQ